MAQHPDSRPSGQAPEIIYHPGPGIVVTSRRIDTDHGRFLIRDLTTIQRVYEYSHPARTIALICGGIELALATPLAVLYGAATLICAGLLVAAGTVAAVLIDSRNNPKWMVLVAVHRGRVVTLYSSRNRQQFEQVRRAVIRATEANEQPEWPPGSDVMVPAGRRGRSVSARARRRRSVRRSAGRS